MTTGTRKDSSARLERSEQADFSNKYRQSLGTMNLEQVGTAKPARLFSDLSPKFDGVCYDPARDDDRLRRQLGRVFELMSDGKWRSLFEIAKATGDPETSTSAQLRNLRKVRFGGYVVERRLRVWQGHTGTFEYRLLVGTKGRA